MVHPERTQHTHQIITILCYAANHPQEWRNALRTDKAFALADAAFAQDQLHTGNRERLIIEFARVFAGVLRE